MRRWQQSSLCPCSSFPMSYFERLPSLSPLLFLATMRLPPSCLPSSLSSHCPSLPTTPREEGTKGTRACSSEHLGRQSSHQWPTTLGTPTTAPWWRGPSPSSPASCSSPSAWSDYCRLPKHQPMDSVTLTSNCHQVPCRTSLIFKTARFRSAITGQVEIFHDVCNCLKHLNILFFIEVQCHIHCHVLLSRTFGPPE